MKIIHTSDWHLGCRLYNYDRTDEEERLFGRLADIAAEERPDALVVSGDVFNTGAPGSWLYTQEVKLELKISEEPLMGRVKISMVFHGEPTVMSVGPKSFLNIFHYLISVKHNHYITVTLSVQTVNSR